MARLSVILCTYKPRMDYLERTLRALDAQSFPTQDWELILVDNASPEPLCKDRLAQWIAHDFRLHSEPNPGLVWARMAGMQTASSDLLIYVDDDNLLAPDYLECAMKIAEAHPLLGAWSGQLQGEFETDPSPEIQPYLGLLAIREVPKAAWANFPDYNAAPWGAGLCVRRKVAETYNHDMHNHIRNSLGARQGSLARGEDTDLAFTACDIGMGIGVFPQLKLTHLMPAGRLEKAYLLEIAEESAKANTLVACLHGLSLPPAQSRLGKLRQWLLGIMQTRSFDWQIHQASLRGQQSACEIWQKLPPT